MWGPDIYALWVLPALVSLLAASFIVLEQTRGEDFPRLGIHLGDLTKKHLTKTGSIDWWHYIVLGLAVVAIASSLGTMARGAMSAFIFPDDIFEATGTATQLGDDLVTRTLEFRLTGPVPIEGEETELSLLVESTPALPAAEYVLKIEPPTETVVRSLTRSQRMVRGSSILSYRWAIDATRSGRKILLVTDSLGVALPGPRLLKDLQPVTSAERAPVLEPTAEALLVHLDVLTPLGLRRSTANWINTGWGVFAFLFGSGIVWKIMQLFAQKKAKGGSGS